MKSTYWIDQVKEKLSLESDYKAAQAMGVHREVISKHRRGACSSLDDENCLKIAELLEVPPAFVIADQQAERAQTEELRKVWEEVKSSFQCILCKIRSVIEFQPRVAILRKTHP